VSRVRERLPVLVEDLKVIGRRGKIRMIENIEKLRAKLDIEGFREQIAEDVGPAARAPACRAGIIFPENSIVLEDGEIQLRQPWSNQGVAAEIPPPGTWTREREALSLDVMVGIAGVCQSLATLAGKPVWWLASFFQFHPIRVAANQRCKRLPAG